MKPSTPTVSTVRAIITSTRTQPPWRHRGPGPMAEAIDLSRGASAAGRGPVSRAGGRGASRRRRCLWGTPTAMPGNDGAGKPRFAVEPGRNAVRVSLILQFLLGGLEELSLLGFCLGLGLLPLLLFLHLVQDLPVELLLG